MGDRRILVTIILVTNELKFLSLKLISINFTSWLTKKKIANSLKFFGKFSNVPRI